MGDKISFRKGTGSGGTGFVSKTIRYKGKAAHAAGSPHLGINALNAASLGLSALAYQRETFQDPDHVRIHPIITKGGDLVNVIPEEVVIETLVRASNFEAILDAAAKTDRAFFAGGAAVGATVEIETMPGYLPSLLSEDTNPELLEAAKIAADGKYQVEIVGDDPRQVRGGSTDVGDVQHIQPVLCFNTGGAEGGAHSSNFEITDEELAYIVTAKIFALGAYRLLKDSAQAAKKVVEEYKPVFTKEKYVEFMNSLIKTEVREP